MAKLANQRNCHLEIERESGANQKLTVKLGHLRPFAAQPREAKMILHQQRKPRENAGVVPKNPKKKIGLLVMSPVPFLRICPNRSSHLL